VKSARNTLPEEPVNAVTGGIDWARDDHAVSVVDARGRETHRTIEHSAAGLAELLTVLGRNGVGEVAIERPDGPIIDTLLEAGTTVVVISPNQIKNLRGRYGSAGNKDDRFDAYVLADTLRTDRARLAPLPPTTPTPWRCAAPAGSAKTSSPTGLVWPTSNARRDTAKLARAPYDGGTRAVHRGRRRYVDASTGRLDALSAAASRCAGQLPCSVRELFRVGDEHALALQLYPTTLVEGGQSSVHCFPGCADQLGEFGLREVVRHPQRTTFSPTEALGQLQQGFGDPSGNVGEQVCLYPLRFVSPSGKVESRIRW